MRGQVPPQGFLEQPSMNTILNFTPLTVQVPSRPQFYVPSVLGPKPETGQLLGHPTFQNPWRLLVFT